MLTIVLACVDGSGMHWRYARSTPPPLGRFCCPLGPTHTQFTASAAVWRYWFRKPWKSGAAPRAGASAPRSTRYSSRSKNAIQSNLVRFVSAHHAYTLSCAWGSSSTRSVRKAVSNSLRSVARIALHSLLPLSVR